MKKIDHAMFKFCSKTKLINFKANEATQDSARLAQNTTSNTGGTCHVMPWPVLRKMFFPMQLDSTTKQHRKYLEGGDEAGLVGSPRYLVIRVI
jgi:hypothetical protein